MIIDVIKRLKPFLASSNKVVARKAADAISRLQAKQYFSNSNANYDNLSEETKTKLFSELKNISSKTCVDFILKGLSDKSQYVRAVAVRAAIDLRDPKLIEKVFPLINDEDPVVRKFCYQFLGLFPLQKISDTLQGIINREKDEDALVALIEMLGEIGSESSLPVLEKMLDELHSDKVLSAIIEAMGKLKI
ncbi:MAG: hypothetical protein OHK0040_05100 [bacterium]